MKNLEKSKTLFQRTFQLSVRLLATTAIISSAAAAVHVGSGAIASQADQPLQFVAADVTAVATRPVVIETGYEVRRVFAGQIEANRTAEISFELGGRVLDVTVNEGDVVVAGQVLARLDTSLLMSERDQLMHSKDAITAQVNLAQQTVDRNQTLVTSGALSSVALSEALSQLDQLAAQRGQVEAQLENVDLRLEKSVVIAPFDGLVAEHTVQPTEIVGSGQTVLRIIDVSSPMVRVGLPDSFDIAGLSDAGIVLPEAMFSARLVNLRPDIDPVTRTRTALFDISGATVIDGQTAKLIVSERFEETGMWVPIADLKENVRGQWALMAVGADDIVRSVAVEIVHADNDQVYVRGVFPEGIALIDQGPQRITLGQRVRRVDAS